MKWTNFYICHHKSKIKPSQYTKVTDINVWNRACMGKPKTIDDNGIIWVDGKEVGFINRFDYYISSETKEFIQDIKYQISPPDFETVFEKENRIKSILSQEFIDKMWEEELKNTPEEELDNDT